MKQLLIAASLMTASTFALAAGIGETPSPKGAEVAIASPADGAVVSGPVTVEFSLKGMEVVPAGTQKPDSGHHHLLIDVDSVPQPGQPIPADDNHIHFGGGETETTLDLAPGTHTLQLIMGDHYHYPHTPPVVSEPVTITVK